MKPAKLPRLRCALLGLLPFGLKTTGGVDGAGRTAIKEPVRPERARVAGPESAVRVQVIQG